MRDHPDWQRRQTNDLAGWINELRCLADHPRTPQGWLTDAMRTIANGLQRTSGVAHVDAMPQDDDHRDLSNILDNMVREMLRLPPAGIPVKDLTERDKMALAIAAGAPYASEMDGTRLTFRTTVPVGIADDGNGKYIVAIGRNACSSINL